MAALGRSARAAGGAGARGAAAGAARGRVVLCRASESWTSASQFRSLSTEQIDAKVVELKGELLDLRIQRAARKEVATHQFKHKRRAMAQLLTVRREKEIEQGIGTRESRKLEKKKAWTPRWRTGLPAASLSSGPRARSCAPRPRPSLP